MHLFELSLACMAAVLNYRLSIASLPCWLFLTIWTTLSLSTMAADALRIFEWFPAVQWVRSAGVIWFVASIPILVARSLWNRADQLLIDPQRRQILKATSAVALTPLSGIGFAIHKANRDAVVKEVNLPIPGLPPDLRGLRLLHISDTHVSSFFPIERLRRVVDQANSLNPDLALITGDLITSYGDPLEETILELARLKASSGIWGCLGNHEIVAEAEDKATLLGQRAGIHFLRSQNRRLHFGKSTINLAGVDYQRKGSRYLHSAHQLMQNGDLNLLLSHNPDVFGKAASQGWDLTLAGHTHGGQVNLEILHPGLNPAAFYTPFTYGMFRRTNAAMYVTSGLGTVGVPARFGTDSEIVLIRLV
jgi:predicted MPP superfamily phosphohydrolase